MVRPLAAALLMACCLSGAEPAPLPSLREQARIQQQWLRARLERNLPALMRKHGVAMWLVISREYNEDPVFFSLVSPATFAARRRTIYVFHDRGDAGVERLALGGGSNGGLYTVYRDPDATRREIYGDSQWQVLRKLVDQRKPATIAVNISPTHAFSDGLSAGEWQQLRDALGPENSKRVVHRERLPLDYIALRVPEMLPVFRQMMETAHSLIARAFSNEVIEPGRTTSQDVVWWLRQELNRQGLGTWFQPTVRVQKPAATREVSFLDEDAGVAIEPGDVLHVDFGITAMRLNTDTQHMGYVLKEGESEPPLGVKAALRQANRLQDIVLERLRAGRSGNEILKDSLAAMKAEKIDGSVYSHAIGDHGHGAGPLIGLWDRQEGVPGRGDVPVLPGTWYSIELAINTPIPEWGGRPLFIGLEEDVAVDESGRADWVLKRQTEYHLVRPAAARR